MLFNSVTTMGTNNDDLSEQLFLFPCRQSSLNLKGNFFVHYIMEESDIPSQQQMALIRTAINSCEVKNRGPNKILVVDPYLVTEDQLRSFGEAMSVLLQISKSLSSNDWSHVQLTIQTLEVGYLLQMKKFNVNELAQGIIQKGQIDIYRHIILHEIERITKGNMDFGKNPVFNFKTSRGKIHDRFILFDNHRVVLLGRGLGVFSYYKKKNPECENAGCKNPLCWKNWIKDSIKPCGITVLHFNNDAYVKPLLFQANLNEETCFRKKI